MLRVWLVTVGEPLPIDGNGGERLYRAGILAELLARSGHDVVWWSSTFDHVRKRQRFTADETMQLQSGVRLILLHGCGYTRNVSLRRIVDHFILGRRFSRLSRGVQRPDVILCSLPPLDLPVATTRYARKYGVPVVIDVRDLWPDIFPEAMPQWSRALMRIALTPMRRQARVACRDAFAITGNAAGFVEWGLAHAGRAATQLDRPFAFGYATPQLTDSELNEAMSFWNRLGLRPGDATFTLCFFGALSRQFDLETVVDAMLALERQGERCRLVICGTGELLESLRSRASDSAAVVFAGWVGRAEIWALMMLSQVGLAPYRNHVGFAANLPNKPIEYLAGGLPILSALQGYLAHFLEQEHCGLTYLPGDAHALCAAILRMRDDRETLEQMSANARRIFRERFAAEKVYGEMMSYLQTVATTFNSEKGHKPVMRS